MKGFRLTTLISEQQIQKRVQEIGKALTEQFKGQEVTAICILKGSSVFFSDIIRQIDTDLRCEFFGVSSYNNSMKSSGEVKITLDLSASIEGKHVLLIEDIVDTGLTMDYLVRNLKSRGAKSLTTCTVLFKPEALKCKVQLDHVGFEIGNEFVVGYGLDYQGYYRNLPYVARIENIN